MLCGCQQQLELDDVVGVRNTKQQLKNEKFEKMFPGDNVAVSKLEREMGIKLVQISILFVSRPSGLLVSALLHSFSVSVNKTFCSKVSFRQQLCVKLNPSSSVKLQAQHSKLRHVSSGKKESPFPFRSSQ